MRITFGTKYNQMMGDQGHLQRKLNDKNAQIASGLKIQYGYQDASVYNQNLKFEKEVNNLAQGVDLAQHARTATLNTDKTLSDLSETMVQFKTKLIHAANDIHNTASREALANDLESLKNHFLRLANTSIGGKFIFGGSRTDRPPFDAQGNYYGNDEKLSVLVSADNLVPFNITGSELFYGRDSDKHKIITTNIRMLNQSKLNPAMMDSQNRKNISEEVYITANDTLRDLIGDNDTDPSNDNPEYFYMRGVRSDGSVFKAKFALEKAYANDDRATRVQDLLDRIGKEFGNSAINKVVEVSINQWGQIEIKDLEAGKSSIDFHLISSDVDVDNVDELANKGARVTKYIQSDFITDRAHSRIEGVTSNADFRFTTLPTAFITKDNKAAEATTKLEDIFPPNVKSLLIGGTRPNNADGTINNDEENPLEPLRFEITGATASDLARAIKKHFGGDIDVGISKGRLYVVDNNVTNKSSDFKDPPFDGEHGFSISLTTLDENGTQVNGISSDYASEYDRTFFKVEGSNLTSSVSQVLANVGGYATAETRLSQVSGASLEGQSYVMKLNDINGVMIEARIVFDHAGAYMLLPSHTGGRDYTIPLFDPTDEDTDNGIAITKPDDITYRQLMDAMSIALIYSNTDEKSLRNIEPPRGGVRQNTKDAYTELLDRAKNMLELKMTPDGKIQIQDKLRSITRMNMSFYDSSSNDFSEDKIYRDVDSIRLNANNALIIDSPEVNYFKEIDEIINAVRKGIYRAGAKDTYNRDLRNKGIQNAIESFDHLSEHIEKLIALNGSRGRTFDNVIHRHEVLKTQIEGLKGQNIGTDIAETYNKFSNLTTNLSAVMNSTSRINQMSLVNYL